MKKNVLITGGTGFIGRYLTSLLIEKGYSVSILSRTKYENSNDISYFLWDVEKGIIDEQAVLEADIIINLAGENIGEKRWTKERKQAIVQSRVQAIQLIYNVLKKHKKKLDVFVSASGIGIYGSKNSVKICSEESPLADDFFIDADLVEAICLSHDLGHPPFGHAGERTLNHLMRGHGGFEGNAQTLRLLTERIFSAKRSGMDPTRAFLDGVLKYKTLFTERPAGLTYGLQVWVDQLAGFLDALGLDKVSLLAHGLGTPPAQSFAAADPASAWCGWRCRGAVAVMPSAVVMPAPVIVTPLEAALSTTIAGVVLIVSEAGLSPVPSLAVTR